MDPKDNQPSKAKTRVSATAAAVNNATNADSAITAAVMKKINILRTALLLLLPWGDTISYGPGTALLLLLLSGKQKRPTDSAIAAAAVDESLNADSAITAAVMETHNFLQHYCCCRRGENTNPSDRAIAAAAEPR